MRHFNYVAIPFAVLLTACQSLGGNSTTSAPSADDVEVENPLTADTATSTTGNSSEALPSDTDTSSASATTSSADDVDVENPLTADTTTIADGTTSEALISDTAVDSAAGRLDVSPTDLKDALGTPPYDVSAIADKLGVTPSALRDALGPALPL